MTHYSNDIIDGRELPPLVITGDQVLAGVHIGTVHVQAGALNLVGTIRGTLILHPRTRAVISGTQAGTISIGAGSTVIVTGAIEGTTHVEPHSTVVIEPGAKLAGSLHNDGLVVLRGVFGGARSGAGELRIEDQGRIKMPRVEGNVHYYDW